jgi:NADH:ubiquinone oxidoreductase subunit F (NADH-binding)/NADH:ubiquinone oxidoreductase subunit E
LSSHAEPPQKPLGKDRRGRPKGRGVDPQALAEIRALLSGAPRDRDLLIEHLHGIQDRYGCLSAPHLVALAAEMGLATTEVYEVATFYHHFDLVKEGQTPPPPLTVRVCDSISCEMAGAEELITTLIEALEQSPEGGIRIQRVPCVGRCAEAPVAVVGQNPVDHATLDAVRELAQQGATSASLPPAIRYAGYQAEGGYEQLRAVHAASVAAQTTGDNQTEFSAERIIDLLDNSKLRGLGGAGFPTGRKWRILRDQPAPRLMAINIDEGEPGTFKDRYFLETDPHRFFEGMLIAAEVVGVDAIYIYLRDEYAGIRALLEQELDALRADPPCPLPPIHLRRGAGAYICGEESAMIESLEGKRGMPRLRPPYVAEVGLFGRPTLEHNMETLYWVRDLLERGADWFASQGRNGRSGLRAFSVSGRVRKPGVHLAPAGITLRELIDEFCGGMLDGHSLYGYFPGGASGGILPASLADVPLDFDTLQPYGCFIGSAAIIVLSQHDSARQAALNAMRFFEHESCGQCTPCREGTAKAARLMRASTWDQPLLDDLCTVMTDASICGLGQAAPNPLRCVMKYFPQELHDGQHG